MERLDHERLVAEQQATLDVAPSPAPGSAREALFVVMDVVYGEAADAREVPGARAGRPRPVPGVGERGLRGGRRTRPASTGFARRVFDRVRVSRWEQDNEQWHLLILEELTSDAPRGSWLKSRLLPQILAFAYYQLSWLMYAIRPAWSYRLNADFEDHAEHEYALLVAEHPEWEDDPIYQAASATTSVDYDSLADLFRQIGYDERLHKLESETNMAAPRFR